MEKRPPLFVRDESFVASDVIGHFGARGWEAGAKQTKDAVLQARDYAGVLPAAAADTGGRHEREDTQAGHTGRSVSLTGATVSMLLPLSRRDAGRSRA